MKLKKTTIALAAALACFGSSAHAVPVDLALSLVIDVSGSVSSGEYNLQMDGYANAFRNATIQSNMLAGTNGATAVNVVFFDSNYYSTTLDAFAILDSIAAINTFADALDAFARPGSGGTSIYTGTNRAIDLMLAAIASGGALEGTTNLVIDVSGDGTSSTTLDQAARNRAATNGITINGLPIGGTGITNYYTANVITPDGFAQEAVSFDDFNIAVAAKLEAETSTTTPGVPEPNVIALLGLGLLSLGVMRRKAS